MFTQVPNAPGAGKHHGKRIEKTATSLLRASLFLEKSSTAQISPRLGASFAPHGTPCSGISRGKQKKVAKRLRASEAARLKLEGFCHAKRMAPPSHTHSHRHDLTLLPPLSCSPHPRTTLHIRWRNSSLLETSTRFL